jgi:Leucine-rich repeat (LRR) protein
MKYLWLAIILLLSSCTSKENVSPAVETLPILPANSDQNELLTEPLILGGRPYVDSSGKAFQKDEAHLIIAVYCNFSPGTAGNRWHSFEGMEQLVNLKFLRIDGETEILETLDLTPLASLTKLEEVTFRKGVIRNGGFRWMEQLTNIKEIEFDVEGDILATVDFTPLASLIKLEKLDFSEKITHLPDLTKLMNIRSISIGTDTTYTAVENKLESLEGIGAPNVRKIWISSHKKIDSFAPLNNLMHLEMLEIWGTGEKAYKIADMANLPSLKHLAFYMMGNTKIDLHGIENMSALEVLYAGNCEPFNIEGIGKLANLRYLYLNLISPEPSLEFLRDMPHLSSLSLEADSKREDYYDDAQAYQVLDMSPLATVKSLQQLSCLKFIIKNISALDVLNIQDNISLVGCRLYDETEKSKHYLLFEIWE